MSPAVVDPEEDLFHEPDPARERWRESFYFDFYDFKHGLGGYSSIGYRPSKGSFGSMQVVWGPGLPTLGASEYGRYEEHTGHREVGGLLYVPRAKLGTWSFRFDGHLNDGGSDVAVAIPALRGADTPECLSVPVSYDLDFTPDQPAYIYEENPEWDGLFDGHVDEVGRVTGTMTVDGRTYEIDGRGAKDHSWGSRDWSRPKGWRWADILFEEGSQLTLWRATFDGTRWLQDGAIYADGAAHPITSFTEHLTFAPRPRADRPDSWEFTVGAGEQEMRGTCEILNVVPLLFSMRDERGEKATMWNDKASFRCTLEDGRVGYGNAEFQFRAPASGTAPRPLVAGA
ncbi:hypothetical protein FSW04_11365 [Baekduia soli]|uniref:AttH domain-containing protein n=1 Tax=Baekduia soli TaxID=496014 RepID=A0A5B8U547_9ACTN|nr:hypothetical protein [Baekduia soli]QEC48107.1 hypothetical protein FSW04_11365 [Baekduia soli]